MQQQEPAAHLQRKSFPSGPAAAACGLFTGWTGCYQQPRSCHEPSKYGWPCYGQALTCCYDHMLTICSISKYTWSMAKYKLKDMAILGSTSVVLLALSLDNFTLSWKITIFSLTVFFFGSTSKTQKIEL